MYKNILVPIDGSQNSRATLTQAIRLAGALGPDVHLTVFHVNAFIPINEVSVGMALEQLKSEEGQAILAEAEPLFAGTGLGHDGEFVAGDPGHEICEKAKRGGYDLIVMGNRGRTLVTELLLGSVSHKVLQHAHCPVLIVRR